MQILWKNSAEKSTEVAKMNLDVKRINQLVEQYHVPVQDVALAFIDKEQKWYDRALNKDLKNGNYTGILANRPEIAVHTMDVIERYLRLNYKK